MTFTYIVKNEFHVFLGSDDLDQVLRVLLGTAMFVGGVLGFILDNTVPGMDWLFSTSYCHLKQIICRNV
jgi:hypothetical protein